MPTVVSTSPVNASTGFAVNGGFTATFSEVMDPSTVTAATFTVKGPGATAVPGTVTCAGATGSFTPAAKLTANTMYTATIAIGAKSAAGAALASSYSWSATTIASVNPTPPAVSSTSPANAATGVAINSGFAATFSEAMDPSTITAATFTVTGPGAAAVSGAVTYTGVTGLFTPAANLAANTQYTATIAIGAKSAAGIALPASYSWSVTTAAAVDTTPPAVSSTSPANGATGVAINSGFAATFSEVMDPSTITTATFTVTGPGAAVVSGAVTYVGVTGVFKPAASLAANTQYTATIAIGAKSAAGIALPASYSWSVTTGSAVDNAPPTVSSTNPANAATGVALNIGLAATFSEAMDPSTITAATFILMLGTTAVPGSVANAGVTANFTPTQPLVANSTYTATILSATDLAGNALASAYSWTFTTGSTANSTAPVVNSTIPVDNATAVATNNAITATFSEAMAPATINSSTFRVTAPGAIAVAGTVVYAGQTATFQPASPLAASTLFTATITTGAKDLSGNALAANHVWSFTTSAAADTTPPTVLSTNPLSAATGVLATASVQVTFSEAMAPQTINSSTFTLTGPAAAAIAGSVVFDAANKVATFQPATSLAANTSYTAKVKGGGGGVTDLAGNALASDYTFSFTSGGHAGLAPVLLGTSANYVILAKTAISTVPASALTGDIALSPAAASFITGFSLTLATGYATSPQVVGKVYAADFAAPTPTLLTTAVSDMQTGYTDAAGRPTPDFLNLNTGAIGGLTLTPGLYKWTSTVTIPGDVTLTGSATDVWILQISGDLTMSASKNVFLTGGAKAKNVFWQVAGTVDIGTTAHFEGIILSQTAITLQTGASMNGRALAQTQVALQKATVTQPAQ